MVADRLKEGDVTDEQFRTLIVGEIDEIKPKARRNSKSKLASEYQLFQGRHSISL